MSKNMRLTDNAYDQFKLLNFLVLPAISSIAFCLYFVFDITYTKRAIGAASFISLLLGVFLTVSTKRYRASDAAYDGKIVVTEIDDKKRFSLELAEDPDDLEKKKFVIFKMVPAEPSLEE